MVRYDFDTGTRHLGKFGTTTKNTPGTRGTPSANKSTLPNTRLLDCYAGTDTDALVHAGTGCCEDYYGGP